FPEPSSSLLLLIANASLLAMRRPKRRT
ncbi:MAG: PEP-CTERM sorting domain-containing protein, partial [Candidatus Udaeobacter sp.]